MSQRDAHSRGEILPAVDADIRSAYSAAFSLTGCWDLLRAADVREVNANDDILPIAAAAAEGDFAPLFDPTVYPRLICRGDVDFAGEYGPVELPGGPGQAPSFHIAPLRSDVPLPLTGPDFVASALLSRRVPKSDGWVRLEPVGTERTRAFPLRDGLVVQPAHCPVAAGVRLRSAAKDAGDERSPVQLRVLLNAMAWGVTARLDQRRVSGGRGRRGQLVETPSTWSYPPIASTVPAVSRMWLALVDRMVSDASGTIIARDTDGLAILASPDGGKITCSDGSVKQALSWAQVDDLLARFDALDPFGDGRPFWTVERGTEDQPLHILSLARKRYVKAQRGPEHWEAIGGTVHSLAGVVEPSTMTGRDADRRPIWTLPVLRHALLRATAAADGGPLPRFDAPWDAPGQAPFPVLRRYTVASPTTLSELSEALGAYPFAPIVEAHPDRLLAGHAQTPVALDPGTEFAEWVALDWHDRYGPVPVSTTGMADGHTVRLQSLEAFAEDWTAPRQLTDPGEVVIDHRLIRRVGRGGALIDAQLAGDGANANRYEVVYSEGDADTFMLEQAQTLGKRAFAERTGLPPTVAERAAAGKPISRRNVERALRGLLSDHAERVCACDGCDTPITRRNQLYCTTAHREHAYRARQKSLRRQAPEAFADLTCAGCGTVLLGSAAQGPCPVCDREVA